MKKVTVAVAALMLVVTCALAEDWPQFRGLVRDGISPEKGLLKTWPDGGPKVVWENSEIGTGFSSVAVVGGKVYTAGHVGNDLVVTALDAKGQKLWQTPIDTAGKGGGHKGSRSTPTVDGDLLYILGGRGKLACLRVSDGKEVWSLNILEKYHAKNTQWDLAESPLIDGDRVICTPGGDAALVALDKKTGEEIWKTEAVDPKPNYASARIIEYGGLRQVVSFSQKSAFGANAANGKLLWTHKHETSYDVNATSAVFDKGILYITSGYGKGGEALKMTVNGDKAGVERVWENVAPDDHFGGVVLLDGKVYGTGSKSRGLTAIELATGNVAYTSRDVAKSSNVYADGRLYCQGHDGKVQLVDPADGKVVSSFTLEVKQKGKMWAHPAISDGKLYIRHDDILTVYDIKAK